MCAAEPYDLLIIGGGVNGAGIARDAAGRGLKVLLCEQGDLSMGTSQWSSKLIHGGLRYLETYEFRLVREALAEREVLLRAAPHIVRPLRFVLPHNARLRPAWMVRIGLLLYDNLSKRVTLPGAATLNLRQGLEGAPLKDSLRKGFSYYDCWVDDSRLVVLNAIDARRRGAEILVGTRCSEARRSDDAWQATLTDGAGRSRRVRAKAVVNAAGPWVDDVLYGALGRNEAQHLRLVKGSHIIVPRLYDGDHAYILQNHDKRVVFAIPYQGELTLIGTTDVPYDGDPAAVAIDEDEVAYLCDAANDYFTASVTPDDVVATFSGVRPLYDDHKTANPSTVTRDYMFDIEAVAGRLPLLSIYGGKITTYRRLAEHAMDKLAPFLPGLKPAWTTEAALPGGDLPTADFDAFLADVRGRCPWLPEDLALRYCRAYGTLVEHIVGGAAGLADLGEHFGGGLYEAEAAYLVDHEWARTADDILHRRTKLYLHMPAAALPRLEGWLASRAVTAAASAAMASAE